MNFSACTSPNAATKARRPMALISASAQHHRTFALLIVSLSLRRTSGNPPSRKEHGTGGEFSSGARASPPPSGLARRGADWRLRATRPPSRRHRRGGPTVAANQPSAGASPDGEEEVEGVVAVAANHPSAGTSPDGEEESGRRCSR